ncbi:Rz1-like lysis system protein LysC [Neptuniibacter pectenicola]|uniref:Rz1-like lysis system protein LysC n=1 Tax=Neptuniibacter pectenicola TaxID=1806669 RepID=UPI003F69511C
MLILLSGCGNTVVRTEYIREQVPAIYTQLIAPPSLDQQYWGYIAECEAIVKQCNVDKESIQQWSSDATKNP